MDLLGKWYPRMNGGHRESQWRCLLRGSRDVDGDMRADPFFHASAFAVLRYHGTRGKNS